MLSVFVVALFVIGSMLKPLNHLTLTANTHQTHCFFSFCFFFFFFSFGKVFVSVLFV